MSEVTSRQARRQGRMQKPAAPQRCSAITARACGTHAAAPAGARWAGRLLAGVPRSGLSAGTARQGRGGRRRGNPVRVSQREPRVAGHDRARCRPRRIWWRLAACAGASSSARPPHVAWPLARPVPSRPCAALLAGRSGCWLGVWTYYYYYYRHGSVRDRGAGRSLHADFTGHGRHASGRCGSADGSGFQAPIISPSPAYAASFPMSSRSSSPPALFPGGGEVTENGVCLLVQSIKHDISHRRVPFGTQRAAPVQIWWKRTNESVHAWFLWYTVRSTYTPHQLIATTQLYLLFTRTALPVTVTSNDPSVLDPVIAYL
jgi:hypothetical protein